MFLLLILAGSACNYFSRLIFHSDEYLTLFYASFLLLGGYSIFVITYASFFGMQKITKANVLQFFLMALLPLIIAYAFAHTKSSALVISLMGSVFYFSLIPLILIIIETTWPDLSQLRVSTKAILKYGIPRVPAGFALAGLFTLGPYLASYFGNLGDAGFFVVGQSVFRVMESAIVAFGLVALPKVAQILADGKEELLKMSIENMLIMIFQLGLFAIIHTFLWSKEIILVWLGVEYSEAIPITRILIISLGPYLGYVMLRSVVDAVEIRAINSLNLIMSLVLAVVISIIFEYVGLKLIGLAIGNTIGFAALGILTIHYLIRRYSISSNNFLFRWTLLLNVILAVLGIIVKGYINSFYSQYNLLIAALVFETLALSGYLYCLYKRDMQWLIEIRKRIIPNATSDIAT
jgi:O-antigen/teichoic acid export membrane protein